MPYEVMNNVRVYGLEESVIASGYPMEDSYDPENMHRLLTEKDWKRAKRLAGAKPGSGHDCFLKGIIVQFDLTLSEKVWPQFQRYHFADFISSMSTVHMMPKMEIRYIKWVDPVIANRFEELVKEYNEDQTRENWLRMIYNYPSGLLLTARITTNYLQLKGIYAQRNGHPIPEWEWFREDMENKLPHFKEWCVKED